MDNPAKPNFEIGTWYFDKWDRCYVQVVAGAQREGFITVYAPRKNAHIAINYFYLDVNRKHRFAQPPLPVSLP